MATRNQPVIAFIWPEYHNRSRYPDELIAREFWRIQLETLFEIADGVIIWSNQEESIDTGSGWWQATVEFVDRLERAGVSINQ